MQLPEPSSDSRTGAGGLPGSRVDTAPSAVRRVSPGLRSLAAVIAAGCLTWLVTDRLLLDRRPIVVGILHSPSSSMAASERSMIDAELLAIDEINRSGGLLGRPIRAVLAGGESEPGALARQAERLIRNDHASVVIACGSGMDRSNVLTVVEQADHLLLHTRPCEGVHQSAVAFSTGAVANQRITPAVQWCHDTLAARRFLFVGPDDTCSRYISAMAADQIDGVGDELVGECFVPRGSTSVDDAVRRVIDLTPDVVLCSFTGDAAAAFFSRLRAAGGRPERTPVVAFALCEEDLRIIDADDVVGHYAAASYFQSIDRAENLAFVRTFKARYGADRPTTDSIAAAYGGIRLWAQAVRESGTAAPRRVRESLRRQSLDAPGGIIAVDPDTQHTWQPVFIGRARGDGQFEIVWTSRTAVRPVPFPTSRSRSSWQRLGADLHPAEGDRWSQATGGRRPERPSGGRTSRAGGPSS